MFDNLFSLMGPSCAALLVATALLVIMLPASLKGSTRTPRLSLGR